MFNLTNAKNLKDLLKSELELGNLDAAKKLLADYEYKFPFDADLFSIKSYYYYSLGNYDLALKIATDGLNKFEFNEELLLNKAIINLALNNFYDGLIDLALLQIRTQNKIIENTSFELFEANKHHLSSSDLENFTKKIKSFENQQTTFPVFKNQSLTGDFIDDNHFCGVYDNYSAFRSNIFIEDTIPKEFDEPFAEYITDIFSTKVSKDSKCDYILPLLSKKTLKYPFSLNGIKFEKILLKNRWYFFKLNYTDSLNVSVGEYLIIGEKIPLAKKDPKLILNIFVDGLSQKFLEDHNLPSLMPNTYRFFKEGTIFNNCYVSGEWTFVSLASMYSGKYTHNHMMYHPTNNSYVLHNQTLFNNILKENSYFTAKIDGDWRSNPSYGYLNGLDRYLYCFGRYHMQSNEVVMHSIEHLETFKGTNQALWVCLPDLHDVADEYEHYSSIQSHMECNYLKTYSSDATSVQKTYSVEKCEIYKHSIKRIDTYISLLLNYVKDNYSEDNYVVNLISDHGQGYLSKPTEEFLNDYRIKVPFMTRGNHAPKCESNELIQGLDLFKVCCNSFDLKDTSTNVDSNLPKTLGGKEERKYVFSESIYPDRPYKACFIDHKFKLYFETESNVTNDCRIDIYNLSVKLTDLNQNILDIKDYIDIVEFYKNELLDKLKNIIII